MQDKSKDSRISSSSSSGGSRCRVTKNSASCKRIANQSGDRSRTSGLKMKGVATGEKMFRKTRNGPTGSPDLFPTRECKFNIISKAQIAPGCEFVRSSWHRRPSRNPNFACSRMAVTKSLLLGIIVIINLLVLVAFSELAAGVSNSPKSTTPSVMIDNESYSSELDGARVDGTNRGFGSHRSSPEDKQTKQETNQYSKPLQFNTSFAPSSTLASFASMMGTPSRGTSQKSLEVIEENGGEQLNLPDQQKSQPKHNSQLKKLIKRSVNDQEQEEKLIDASNLYDKFVARCCNNNKYATLSLADQKTNNINNSNNNNKNHLNDYHIDNHHRSNQLGSDRQQLLLDAILRLHGQTSANRFSNGVRSSRLAKRDLTNQLVASSRSPINHALLRSPSSARSLPTCHQLASLWTHLKSAYPALAANLLSAVNAKFNNDPQQQQRVSIFNVKNSLVSPAPRNDSSTTVSSEQHRNVLQLLSRADNLIAQLEAIAPSSDSHHLKQQQQQPSPLDQSLRQHQLEKLLSNPTYAKILRRVQLREGINSRLISPETSQLPKLREIQFQEPNVNLDDNSEQSQHDNRDLQQQDLEQQQQYQRRISLEPSLPSDMISVQAESGDMENGLVTGDDSHIVSTSQDNINTNNNNDYKDKLENLVNEDYGFGLGVQPPIVTRKPPNHVSFGRIIYHPSEASSKANAAENGGQTINQHGTIDKLHHLYKFTNNKQLAQQTPAASTLKPVWTTNPDDWSQVRLNDEILRTENNGDPQYQARFNSKLIYPKAKEIIGQHKSTPETSGIDIDYDEPSIYNENNRILTAPVQPLGLLDSLRDRLHRADEVSSDIFSPTATAKTRSEELDDLLHRVFKEESRQMGRQTDSQVSGQMDSQMKSQMNSRINSQMNSQMNNNNNDNQPKIIWPKPGDARLAALDDKNLEARIVLDRDSLEDIKYRWSKNPKNRNKPPVNWNHPFEVSSS